MDLITWDNRGNRHLLREKTEVLQAAAATVGPRLGAIAAKR